MANERKTERYVREALQKRGYFSDKNISVEEQKSDNPKVQKLLKTASKRGGGAGLPEFIITSSDYPELLIVIECKASTSFHRSATLDKFDQFACDGSLLYAANLSKNFDVIAIAVSGEKSSEIKIDHFLHLKGQHRAVDFAVKKILSLEDYHQSYIQTPEKFNEDYSTLLAYTQELNTKLHKLKVKESQRSLLISGILISLKNPAFRAGFTKHHTAKQLTQQLVQTVVDEMTNAGVPKDRIDNLRNAYSFIRTHALLSQNKVDLIDLIEEVDREINGFMRTHAYFDTIGQFYIEFLRYANNDKGLGIVLTPPHITELFVDLAGVTLDSVVWDNCCGTGGFLISAMKKMVRESGGDTRKVSQIKRRQIFGMEYQDDIYALAVSNMILHGDGKSSIFLGSCFEDSDQVVGSPTVGLLNPPYKSDAGDTEELEFILNNLGKLERNGRCVAIIPISCVLQSEGVCLTLKQRLLRDHTLEAIMSMPEDLFHNSDVGVITCAIVVTAHVPHPKGKKTWLGYWRNDGFIKVKGKGRIDATNAWPSIREHWIDAFQNRTADGKQAVMVNLKAEDEWCAEAYLKTDYSTLSEEDFARSLKHYMAFQITGGMS